MSLVIPPQALSSTVQCVHKFKDFSMYVESLVYRFKAFWGSLTMLSTSEIPLKEVYSTLQILKT